MELHLSLHVSLFTCAAINPSLTGLDSYNEDDRDLTAAG